VRQLSLNTFRFAILISVILLTCESAWKQNLVYGSSSPGTTRIEQYIKQELERGGFPSLSVGIVLGDELVYAKAFGVMDRRGGQPATLSTLYRVGSVGKIFTAMLLMILRDQGVVRLDDPLAKYLPADVKLPSDPSGSVITLRNLVTHTSGLPEWGQGEPQVYEFPGPDSVTERYRSVIDSRLEFPTGKYFRYSGLGYSLLGEALERVAGKPYEALLTELVFRPLRMNDTAITLTADQRSRVPAQYKNDGSEVLFKPNDPNGTGNRFYWPAGGHYSTVPDLAKFLALQFKAGEPDIKPVTGSTLLEMQTPQRLQNTWNLAIGMGWWIEPSDELGEIVWHKGGSPGCSSFIAFTQRYNLGVIVLANRNKSTEEVGRWLLNEAVKQYGVKKTASAEEADRLFALRAWSDAAWAYRTITERSPQNGQAWFGLGSSLHSLRKCDQAIPVLQHALELGVRRGEAMYLIGSCYALKDERRPALEWLQKAIKEGPNDDLADQLGTDADLDHLRDDPRFKRLRPFLRP